MKKQSFKKLFSVMLSFIFCVSIVASIPFSAQATFEAYFLDGSIATEATFILDPGHGGEETGALADVDSEGKQRREADDNLNMALKVAAALEAKGETVALTRITDKTVALIDRSHISNAGDYKIFCSLHRNFADNKAARGIETYYFNSITAESSSAKIASKVHENVMTVSDSIVDRGVRTANFSVLRETFTCALLIESLFVSNQQDNILYDEIESDLALAIAKGLIESKGYAIPDYVLDEKYYPADLGNSFVASITIPYADLALTNNGNLNVVATPIDNTDGQLWKFEKLDKRNAYKLTSLLDNKCLDIESAKTTNEANVMVWDDNGLNCQKYYFYSINGLYCIRSMHCTNDRVIDVNAVNHNAQIYDLILTNPNQQFDVVKVDDDNDNDSSSSTDDNSSSDVTSKLELTSESKYTLENDLVLDVKPDTDVVSFAANFKNEVIISDIGGNVVSGNSKIGSGFIVCDPISDEKAIIVVAGDIDGDGTISTVDYLNIKMFFLNIIQIDGVYITASDVDRSGKIDTTDYFKVKLFFLGETEL